MEPGHREEYIAYLRAQGQWGAAAAELATVVNDDGFRSLEGKSKHQLWLELCDVVTKHPDDVRALDVAAIIRAGIRKFTNEARTTLHSSEVSFDGGHVVSAASYGYSTSLICARRRLAACAPPRVAAAT